MRMKKLMILAVAAIALVACSRTFEKHETEGVAIGFGTWNEVMTKAQKTAFATGEKFEVFGYKYKDGETPTPTSVFTGDEVELKSTGLWEYSPLRFWDPAFNNYTFFAVFPEDQLSGTLADYAQTGLFVTNSITYDGTNEKLLVAQKKTVATGNSGNAVPLVFKHAGALIDFKFKKAANLEDCEVTVNTFKLYNILTAGTFEVASYDGDNNPVGKTVSEVAGLGWTAGATKNAATSGAAAAPYVLASAATIASDSTTPVALIENLVVMPQKFTTGDGSQAFEISYQFTDEAGTTNTYTATSHEIGKFDGNGADTSNDSTIGAWKPGIHYTYYITIDAKGIEFTASIAPWTEITYDGHYYLLN